MSDPDTAVELTEDQELDAIFDKHYGEANDDAPADPPAKNDAEPKEDSVPERDESGRFRAKEGKGDEDEAEPGADAEAKEGEEGEEDDAPKEGAEDKGPEAYGLPAKMLPAGVRDAWSKIPEDARPELSQYMKRLADNSAQAGRVMNALGPTHEALQAAVKDIPELAKMTPKQLAEDAMELAKTRAQLIRDPQGTLTKLAQQFGVQIGQAEAGQEPQRQTTAREAELHQQVRQLTEQVQQLTNPDTIRGQVDSTLAVREVERTATDWMSQRGISDQGAVVLAQFIPAAQDSLGVGASHTDVLDAAYDMAQQSFGFSASPQPAAPAPEPQAPRKTQPATAKSVNVSSSASKPAEETEDQILDRVWRQHMSR